MDSAVGLDGVPYSLFKVPFPWWQRALLNFFDLVLGCETVSPPTIAPSLLRRAASNSSSIWSIPALDRSSLPNSTCAREDSDGVLMCWSVHSLMFCHHADLLSHSLLSWTSRKRLTRRGFEGILVRLHEVGVTWQMWHLMCHFLRNTQSQV